MAKEEKKDNEKKCGTSMIAPHPLSKGKKKTEALYPVEDLSEEAELKPWEAAGVVRATGWAEGKQVSRRAFETALIAFRKRPQGGGRIAA